MKCDYCKAFTLSSTSKMTDAAILTHLLHYLHIQMKGLLMLRGDGGDAEQRVWIWYPLLVGGSHVPLHPLHPTYHAPWGNSIRGCRGGTGHCAIEGINWCGTFLVHMAKAIKYLPKAFSLPFLNQ